MQLNITEIVCVNPSAPVADDFFLIAQVDGSLPTRYPLFGVKLARAGQTIELPSPPASQSNGLVYTFDYGVIITAFDRDYKFMTSPLNDNDFLFALSVNFQSQTATLVTENHNGASYKITYTVTA